MSWHEVCQFLDQSDPNDGLGTHKREKMPLSEFHLEDFSYDIVIVVLYRYIGDTRGIPRTTPQ